MRLCIVVTVGLFIGACVVALGVDFSSHAHRAPGGWGGGTRRAVSVTMRGTGFRLEVASETFAQERGLGGRTGLASDAGMLFVFPSDEDQLFVMKDCADALDLIYLDQNGRVLSVHAMTPEAPRNAAEVGDDVAYTARLKGYASGSPARYAVEVAGGTVRRVGLVVGDTVLIEVGGL